MKPQIAPSILSADFYDLRSQIESVKSSGATVLHVDVMDGIFVPNISVGIPVVKSLAGKCGMTLDVHLMMFSPERYIGAFAEAGADWITVHLEAAGDNGIKPVLEHIRGLGLKAGMSVKPETDVGKIREYISLCDIILLMTVPPGFGGQSYDPNGNARIAAVRAIIDELNPDCILSVDGGIDEHTITGACRAGAKLFAVGSAVFAQPDPGAAVTKLTELITSI